VDLKAFMSRLPLPQSLLVIPLSYCFLHWVWPRSQPTLVGLVCGAGRGAHQMAGLLADLTPVAAEAGAAEGDPRQVYTWTGAREYTPGLIRWYLPSDGGASRLVARVRGGRFIEAWDTGTGAFLGALQGFVPEVAFTSLITYQPPSGGRPRVAAGSDGGHFCIWDGDDFQLLHAIPTDPGSHLVQKLAVYEEPTTGKTRLVTG
jgi:hypothetical protein